MDRCYNEENKVVKLEVGEDSCMTNSYQIIDEKTWKEQFTALFSEIVLSLLFV